MMSVGVFVSLILHWQTKPYLVYNTLYISFDKTLIYKIFYNALKIDWDFFHVRDSTQSSRNPNRMSTTIQTNKTHTQKKHVEYIELSGKIKCGKTSRGEQEMEQAKRKESIGNKKNRQNWCNIGFFSIALWFEVVFSFYTVAKENVIKNLLFREWELLLIPF